MYKINLFVFLLLFVFFSSAQNIHILRPTGKTTMGYFGNPIPATGTIDRGVHQFSTMNNENTPGGFAKDEFDVYLLIGQSNMAGRGDVGALDEVPLENAYLFNATDQWETVEVPLNKYSTVRKDLDLQKLNPGYTFARKLTEYTNRGIGLVVNARGGTNIEQWQKGYSGHEDYNLYEEAVARLLIAIHTGNFKGIIWHQGEANQSSSITYMAKLKQLVQDLRTDLDTYAFFVAGEINQWREASEPINNVMGSIANDINQASYIKSDDLAPINGDLDDPHFDGFSQRILGGLYADEILENVYGMSTGVASLYSQCDFQGYKVSLRPGIYNLTELEKRGIIDNDIRSIKIDPGYEVLAFTGQQEGRSVLISSSANCLTGTSVNEDVSFVVISETGTADEMLSMNVVNIRKGRNHY